MKYFLVIDAGTGASRCVLFDMKGSLVCSSYAEWGYENRPDIAEGAIEFSPDMFWEIISKLVKETLSKSAAKSEDIICVSVTSQREGMVYIDRSGKEIYSAPSLDVRGWSEIVQLRPFEAEIQSVTGLPLHGMFGLARLVWFKNHKPEIYSAIRRVMMMSDWVAYRLTGECATEPSIASSSQLFNVAERQWAFDLVKKMGLRDDIFPTVYNAGTPIGQITDNAAAKTGLAPGTPVAMGGGDTQAGILGMGLKENGQLAIIAGTTTPVMYIMEKPRMDEKSRVYTNCHSVADCWTMESNAGLTGLAVRWAKDIFIGNKVIDEDPYGYMAEKAREVPIGADGMVAYIGMEIAGRQTNSNLGGYVFPVPWDPDDFNINHFFRATMESQVYAVKANIDQVSSVAGATPNTLHVCGGQSKSKYYCQDLADITGITVNIYEVKESSSLGAAICSAVGIGCYSDLEQAMETMVRVERVYNPDPIKGKLYRKAYERWLSINNHLTSYKDI